MNQALNLPEIVSNIVPYVHENFISKTLYSCLFINKTFWHESARLMWETCGAGFDYWSWPSIKDLVLIAKTDPERAQLYANFIQHLIFSKEEMIDGIMQYDNEEARFHGDLRSLKFPRLKFVELTAIEPCEEMNTGEAMMNYLGPNVEEFRIGIGSKIRDSFFQRLMTCPKLTFLAFERVTDIQVSPNVLVDLIGRAYWMSELNIRNGFEKSWSKEAFVAISELQYVETLTIPDIEVNWISELDESGFPSLKHIKTGTTKDGLDSLAILKSDIEYLYLDLRQIPPDQHILQGVSNFRKLALLEIKFGFDCRVNGVDFLNLAKSCPGITELSISGSITGFYSEGEKPFGEHFNDQVIEEFACLMPEIQLLDIAFSNSSLLTWKSIHSLGKSCKVLRSLRISGIIRWEEDTLTTEENLFPVLTELEVVSDNNQLRRNESTNFDDLVSRLRLLAPELRGLHLNTENEFEYMLNDRFMDLVLLSRDAEGL